MLIFIHVFIYFFGKEEAHRLFLKGAITDVLFFVIHDLIIAMPSILRVETELQC